ncbi:hypothetical protein [Pelagovum pacificum]|uniref:Uncharacterized protein n=1 Tax=Pelagovum pacificum TaxID=2588711 RepID=A0A5C5GHG6_9RHOB|nr:hypothetical protein [Pelagovum pacificum]QQA42812.1 hypothetical protein I8N54_18910 [Pelagovum pacificum]TNY34040.1 hypothetical protein FHY64_12480 [Pelagovum pacificum]
MKTVLSILVALAATGAAAQEALPACDTLEPGDAGGVDCSLPGRGEARLVFDYTGDEGLWQLAFIELDSETVLFTSPVIDVEGVNTAPELRDITGDGTAELFVPYSAGMVNIYNQVWTPTEAGWSYMGDLGGFGAASIELRDGLIINNERSSAAVYYETAMTTANGMFEDVYEMEIDYAAQACSLVEGSAFASAGLSAEDLITACEARDW